MTQVINDDVEIQGNLEVQGNTLTSQLNIEGDSLEDPLQTWKDSAGNLLARMTAEGQLQVGSFVEGTGAFGTGESHIEVYRDENDTGKPTRGMNITGGLADNGIDPLEDPISWVVQELTLKGSQGVKAPHTVLRLGLTNDNTGPTNDGGALHGADVQVFNKGGGSGANAIPDVAGINVSITNQDGGNIVNAYGIKVNITDENAPSQIQSAYALQANGIVELLTPSKVPTTNPPAETVWIYVKSDGKLYARISTGEYLLTNVQTGQQVQIHTHQDANNGGQLNASNIFNAGTVPISRLPLMSGATSGAAGLAGMVPQPVAGENKKVLTGAGIWDSIGLQLISQAEFGSVVSLTITNIPSSYKHLRIHLRANSFRSGAPDRLVIKFNGSSTGYYCYSRNFSTASSVRERQTYDGSEIDVWGMNGAEQWASNLVLDIFDYSSTLSEVKAKSFILAGQMLDFATNKTESVIGSGVWNPSTSQAISSIYLAPVFAAFNQWCAYSIWGVI